jgi:hypothetical protein
VTTTTLVLLIQFLEHSRSDMTSLVISHVAFTELATNYGPIDQFWFDHGNDLFVDLVDEFQPDALVLGRDFISDGAPALALGGTEQVRNTPFLSRSILKLIILPRQARDKHIGEVDNEKGAIFAGLCAAGSRQPVVARVSDGHKQQLCEFVPDLPMRHKPLFVRVVLAPSKETTPAHFGDAIFISIHRQFTKTGSGQT